METGSAVTWKYPSCVLQGDNSVGEFYSVAITNNRQQADTGTKMIHIGKNTTSKIISKGISAGCSNQTYRGLVRVAPNARGARNYSQCDSLLIGENCGSHTVPYIETAAKPRLSNMRPPPAKSATNSFLLSAARYRRRGSCQSDC